MKRRVWTVDEVRALGVLTDVPTAASVLGIGRTAGYDLARCGDFPVPVLRMRGRLSVPVAPLMGILGAIPDNGRSEDGAMCS